MPRINIIKMPDLICEYCGKRIGDSAYCEIITTNKVIKMHQMCAIDFAISILKEFSRDSTFREEVNRKIIEYKCNLGDTKEVLPPHAHKGVYEGGEYKYYEILDYDVCCRCEHFSDNKKEERYECGSPTCYRRDGEIE